MWDVIGDKFDLLNDTKYRKTRVWGFFLDKPELEADVFDIADENEYEMIA